VPDSPLNGRLRDNVFKPKGIFRYAWIRGLESGRAASQMF
jgi:hypothetical protein